jgi:peptidyl-dipeptidase Dcp
VSPEAGVTDNNPLLEPWTAPFGLPPFARIAPEHFPPAFDHAMAETEAEIAAIARSPEPPSFANTIEALERRGRRLSRVSNVFYALVSSHTSDALEAVARDYAPKLAEHEMRIALDPDLFRRIDELHARRETLGLAEDQRRLLERRHLDLVRSGARLGPAEKARMATISSRLATLQTLFGQNVLQDEREWHLALDDSELDGLPDFLRAAAAEAAAERGLAGRHVVTSARSSVEPFLTFSRRRDLRQRVWDAWMSRGAHDGERDNRRLIPETLALRAEQARLLGYASYADYVVDDSMAKTVSAVDGLLRRVWAPAKATAAREHAALQNAARAEGLNAPIAPWDWRYYAEQVRRAEYDVDEAEVKPYFVLDNIARAAFATAERLFGVTFAERRDLPAYHEDVRTYEMRDREGRVTGLFQQDNFARPGKRSGAWMSSLRVQESFDGEVLPIVLNNNNFARGNPTLLSFADATTLFHEFGHALHGLLSRVRYPSQSGTAVRRDFVEFPSQLLERWIEDPEMLRRYARHHQTGEPLPDALLERLLAARRFNQGFATVEYAASALLDLELHTDAAPQAIDIDRFEDDALARLGMPQAVVPRHRPAHFQHIFAGSSYAAGYYVYLWAETLDADAFAAFSEAGNPFDAKLAARLQAIYAAGDTREPMALFRAFRGRDPDIAALLQRRGFAEEPAA